jgi:hypothetical protein
MSNARTLANTINSSSQIVVPSGGVNFGTSTDGSGTVTGGVLDDYEEGSFSLELADSPSGGNVSSTTLNGRYTKIGRQVNFVVPAFNINTAGMNTSSVMHFRGFPFNCNSSHNGVGTVWCDNIDFSGTNSFLSFLLFVDTNYGYLYSIQDNSADVGVTISAINNGVADVVISGFYLV